MLFIAKKDLTVGFQIALWLPYSFSKRADTKMLKYNFTRPTGIDQISNNGNGHLLCIHFVFILLPLFLKHKFLTKKKHIVKKLKYSNTKIIA
jgi:hypothetical protein